MPILCVCSLCQSTHFIFNFTESHLKYFVLYYINIFIPLPLLRTTFPPFSRPLWGAPTHPERTGAALGSPKAQGQRGPRVVYAAVYAARSRSWERISTMLGSIYFSIFVSLAMKRRSRTPSRRTQERDVIFREQLSRNAQFFKQDGQANIERAYVVVVGVGGV